ncbi:MAG TPA: VCBS repeat-containing protein [Spirochaetia bacterium]|nr:VCBS repeat-containing protein [Spirochaetia bacterium]
MAKPRYTKKVVGVLENPGGPGPMNTLLVVGDVNSDGRPDIVLSGRNGNLAWFENRGQGKPWERHPIDDITNLECGGCLYDLMGKGRPDLINGSDYGSVDLLWWENPGAAGGKWVKRIVAPTGNRQFHDTLIGDVTGDGSLSLVFTNQHGRGGTWVYRVPLPQDPRQSPWPGLEVIVDGITEVNPGRPEGVQPEEGVAIGDVDGDGKNEVVAGTHWYKKVKGAWQRHKFASGYITTKIQIADIDGDGKNEIVLSEGDPCVYGRTRGGKAGWFKPKGDLTALWEEHVLEDNLLDAHSLRVADLCGNGRADILVGEVGFADHATDAYVGKQPQLLIFENTGKGEFTRHLIDEGTGCHDAWLADLYGRRVLDIVTRPLHGPEKWNLHVYERER